MVGEKTQRVGMRSKKESIMIKIGVNRLKKIRRGVEMQIMVKRDWKKGKMTRSVGIGKRRW